MFSLILENKNGVQLTFDQNSPFTVAEIQGLNPPEATINTSEIALMDGAKFNSAKVNMRTINVAFAIETSAALNRINVYKVLRSKQWVRLYYQGDYRNVYVDGYVQSIDISYFEMKQIVTCSILCPDPFFKNAQEMINEMQTIINSFHFPFASTAEPELVLGYFDYVSSVNVNNDGDVDCGMIIELYCKRSVTNPKVYDYITQEFIGVNYTMESADLITIDTRQGHKTATLLRNGVETNLFNYIMKNSTWLQLDANGGTFVYEVETGDKADLIVTFKHYDLFEGV